MNRKTVFKPGEMVDIFNDPQQRTSYVGRAKLIRYVRTSLPFMLEPSSVSEHLNLYYVVEYWVVELGMCEVLRGIRRVYNIGITTSDYNEIDNTDSSMNELFDDFRILPDYDTSFWRKRVSGSDLKGHIF